jgi:hypothetical protein
MEFVLYYRGPLRANRKPPEKHELRRQFHTQLAQLWQQNPLNALTDPLLKKPEELKPGELSILERVGAFTFVPLVCSRLRLVTSLAITMLRPEPPGTIVTQAGDIDNRLKTLLDALKMPSPSEIPSGETPGQDENPFFCLLQDDSLITKLVVETERLLVPSAEPCEVVLLIRVQTSRLVTTYKNIDL